jgi:hypothetical protein
MFCDAGESGAKAPSARFGLSEALAKVRSGELAGIVVAKLDRLSRSCRDVAELVLDAESHGWDLLSVSEKLDTSTPSGKLQVRILASFAEFERDMISERTREGLAIVAKQGRNRSHKAPFGWRLVAGPDSALTDPPVDLQTGEPMVIVADDRARPSVSGSVSGVVSSIEAARGAKQSLERNEAERVILDRMVELNDAGNGAWRIANTLNAEGTGNPRTGRPWNYGTVAHIIRTYRRREKLGVA